MNNNTSKIIFTLVIVLSGCFLDNREFHYVVDETILDYYKGAKLVYLNELAQKDTFIVINKDRAMQENTLKGQADEIYDERYYFEFKNVNDTSRIDQYNIYIWPDYSIRILWGINRFDSNTEDILINNFEIPYGKIDNVHLLRRTQTDGIIDTLYYHYKYGVLQYRDENNQLWKLKGYYDNYFYSR